jgi:hypothetical protein
MLATESKTLGQLPEHILRQDTCARKMGTLLHQFLKRVLAFVADVGCAAEIDHELASVKPLGGFAPAFLEFVDPWLNQLPFYDQPPFSPGIES